MTAAALVLVFGLQAVGAPGAAEVTANGAVVGQGTAPWAVDGAVRYLSVSRTRL